jgi:hypothetical protein
MVELRFEDYGEVAQGWYPHKVTYLIGDKINEQQFVQKLDVNVSIDPSVFEPSKGENVGTPSSLKKDEESPDDKRIREIIKLLREKYQ